MLMTVLVGFSRNVDLIGAEAWVTVVKLELLAIR